MTNSKTTITSRRQAIPRAASIARLRVVHPPELSADVLIEAAEVTLGREEDSGVTVVADPTVSRRHFSLRWQQDGSSHVLTDQGSHNGTHINGVVAASGEPVTIQPGSIIRFGDVLAVLESHIEEQENHVRRDALPGDSGPTRQLRTQVARAAADPSPALLLGDTGTGKEIVARELHRLSGRSGPLSCVNCAALGGQLVESELFGHVKGAFTDATQDHPGLFRAAASGSIFLDEIGDLPLDLQPKLLRAIEAREVRPVGSTTSHRVDVRVLAATNRDLQEMVAAGTFRRDLYARLSLWLVKIPRLQQRVSDLFAYLRAVHHAWLTERGRAGESNTLTFDADAAEILMLHAWEDNVRGLVRLVHEIAETPSPITVGDLPDWLLTDPPTDSPVLAEEAKPEAPTREQLLDALRANNGSVRAVAKQLHRHRNQIYRWMKTFDISRENIS
jgi:transcriptional regulator with PAS, ATPase and Fis domain